MVPAAPSYLHETRAAYDLVAVDYARLLHDELQGKALDRALLRAFAESAGQFSQALVADVGCGTGRITGYLRGLGLNAFGIDLSPGMLAVARRDYPGVRFEEGSMVELDLPENSLAGLLAWYSIIHVPPAALPTVFTGFHRVLLPSGQLLLAFQAGNEKRRIENAYGHEIALDAYRLPPEQIAELLGDAGFHVQEHVLREPDENEKTPQAYLLAQKPGS